MLVKELLFFIYIASLCCVCSSQSYRTSCNHYSYNNNNGEWSGNLNLPTNSRDTVIAIKINFAIAGQISNYHGRIEHLQGYVAGSPVLYRIHLPASALPPQLTNLIVNNKEVCSSTAAHSDQYYSSITLNHQLFLRTGSPGLYSQINDNQNSEVFKPSSSQTLFMRPSSVPFGTLGLAVGGSNLLGLLSSDLAVPKPSNEGFIQAVNNRDQFATTNLVMNAENISPGTPTSSTAQTSTAQTSTTAPKSPPVFSKCGLVEDFGKVPLIYGGEEYMRGEWPWLVAIYQKRKVSLSFICGGVLVSESHVVTAAHCKRNANTHIATDNFVIKIGAFDIDAWDDEHFVTRSVSAANLAEKYDSGTLANDIMILTLSKPVTFTKYIRPVCLWSGDEDQTHIIGLKGFIAGWGRSEVNVGGGTGEPRVIRLPIVSTDTCRAAKPDFHYITSNTTFCAGERQGSGPCLGDSGGGLYINQKGRWTLRGIASLALKSDSDSICDLNEYTVFTDAAKFSRWIRTITGIQTRSLNKDESLSKEDV